MNVVFTCGGTGGHINPAIAIANIWKERHPDTKFLFVGGGDELEQELVPKAGYELVCVPAYGIRRSRDFKSIMRNVKAVWLTVSGIVKCRKIFKKFQPDIVVGTGGYASFQALAAGRSMKIPTCVHESNAMPGMTTKMAAKFVDKVLVCFPESIRHYKDASRVEVVGMPVRREFIYTRKEDARRELGLDSRPVIMSAFGSQGAMVMNQTMAELFRMEKQEGFPYQHIHAVGSFGWEWMPGLVKEKGVDLQKDTAITMKEYLYNMPTVMAAADVVISRAGASTCNEIAASGTPCVLIPSPNVTDNHQEKNARAMEKPGGAVVILESECSPEKVYQEVKAILEDKKRQETMQKALHSIVVPDSAERVCGIMEKLMRG